MSTSNPILNEVFFFRIEQSIITNPAVKWHSTHAAEFVQLLGDRSQLDVLATRLANFHAQILRNHVQIDRVVVSSAMEIPNLPTTPDDFYVLPVNLIGVRTNPVGNEPCDLDVVLHLRRAVQTGHWGHLYLRGVLGEGDITAPSGRIALSSVGAFDSIVNNAVSDSTLDEHLSLEESSTGLNLCTYKVSGLIPTPTVKWISSFQVVNATRRKYNYRYYNRS